MGEAPTGPNAWTAAQLLTALQTQHDIVSLSGHFSTGSLLASDYTTQLTPAQIAAAQVNLTNVLVLALGCHSGFSIPNPDLLAGASPNPDWAKFFLRQGAAGYVSSTAYAYGDTVLTSYGEMLFWHLAQQLRTGTGPISLGQALVAAKRQYLAETAQLTGIDQKTIIETTLYGLPMMKINMPGARITPPAETSIVSSTAPVPGTTVSLTSASVTLNPTLTTNTTNLTNLANNSSVTATYLSGPDGVVSNPFEPIFPKQIYDVNAAGQVLRGAALRGGTYTDANGIVPLTSAPTTELSAPHQSFNTPVFYPNQTWMTNFDDAISGGNTRLLAIPAQFQSSAPGAIDGTLRKFSQLNMQLYYLPSNWTATGSPAAVKDAAVSAAPLIEAASAAASGNSVTFSVNAQADGPAGVQAVWVLYTGRPGSQYYGQWQPLDLTKDTKDLTLWSGTLTGVTSPSDLLFMVQAVGGAGLTTLDTNQGAYYSLSSANAPAPVATTLTLQSPPSSGVYLKSSTFNLSLKAAGNPLPGQVVTIDIGGQQALATTDSNGNASISLKPVVTPGSYTAQASFPGSASYLAATANAPFTLAKDSTSVGLTPTSASIAFNPALTSQPTPMVAVVHDSSGNALSGKSVFFIVHNATQNYAHSVIADFLGNAPLGAVPLPAGVYTVDVYFNGTIPVDATHTV
ncbi:MAG TPA: Ig-like domain-containing protein, partial [Polyangia bacterium]